METSTAVSLAIFVAIVVASLFLFKKALYVFFALEKKTQAVGIAVLSIVAALLTKTAFVTTTIVYATLFFGFWLYILYKAGALSNKNNNEQVMRGNQLVTEKTVINMLKEYPHNIKIGNIPLPKHLETRHMLIAGTTGAGKTQIFHQILRPVRDVGERAIVPDVGGENLSIYFKPGDIILNPFDARSEAWSPLSEIRGQCDCIRIATSIIPDGVGSGAEWNGYAQKILAAVLSKTWEADGNNGDIVRWCVAAPMRELKQFLEGSAVEGMFSSVQDDGSAKGMITEVRNILSSYIVPLQYLDEAANSESFSIREFMKKEGSAWLFLPFTDPQKKSLIPLISSWLDISISGLLELDEDEDRRIWFPIDEFATFGQLGCLNDLLTRSRRYGGCAVLGVQSISQVPEKYGEKSQALLACLSTQAILRCPDAATSEALSLLFGEQDIQRTMHSTSHSGGDVSHSQSVQYITQRVVLASEIQLLPDLTALYNTAGETPPCLITIPVTKKVIVAERFVPKPRKQIAKKEEQEAA